MREKSRFTTRLVFFTIGATLALAAQAFAASSACSADARSRQLDYWLGTWTIHHQEAAGTATSRVTTSLGQCLVVEDWKDGRGHEGKNLFGYNPGDDTWHGLFADNHGHLHVFTDGKVDAGVAEFHGPSRGDEGKPVLNRLRIVRQLPDKVEQTWEQSSDNGATWKLVFHGEYARENRKTAGGK